LALQAEDFCSADAHLEVSGWGGLRRRVLIDDPRILARLIDWSRTMGGKTGPMFSRPGGSTPLRYQSVEERWRRYTTAADVSVSMSDLRRAHAAELIAGGVPDWVIRHRLGQKSRRRWSESDAARADEAIRAWRSARDGTGAGPHMRRRPHQADTLMTADPLAKSARRTR